ncbi:glucose-1-phosphate adenylyltransferase large subunit 2, chloroplastic/amyloplastic [Solanum tuberosum]|uniref:Glucose-1-phosphate adenylyltransferase large subunit 2, chloroplastic/amyloplastic n=1 Tax=Solanum tuberosum TaxID=4113 RepID=GLGL2_SOLTU|nr:glucose-1-phosphate adenylyltransferase large subunit 2, chloroplastic/amyloplastic [Solanum tuberosum]P55242.1 RecName: Full=Glucose-1-phosphate adenylyltransferase large subunit 2, chloroplastic/amyloplastic; AltName: Full=ADP-glucose pyrophosphorylase; AltName: Full=ADP-glucose synthase; AltName: Full=AGPase S; AltName: Full=Alpha-D-glucose-1-phosphate adenyl transferase; Flags: Precursor [Solanum tuberosum]CAA52917.1 ADP-glucose-pyrophosphorylase [Solanum tuberosum]
MDALCASMKGTAQLVAICNQESAFWGEKISGRRLINKGFGVRSCKSFTTQQRGRNVTPAVLTRDINKEMLPFEESMFEEQPTADPKAVASVILGGGVGTRLFPLTSRRAKPAVPIGGCYRLIDVPMSNCINSGIRKIFILTQFNSFSLNRHLATYNFGNGVGFGDGFVEVLAGTQTPGDGRKMWFQAADAVREFIWVFENQKNKNVEHIIILSGDHLYRMNYMDFVQKHIDTNADITVSCVPMDDGRASDFGLMKIDETGAIIQFAEKPKGPALKAMQVDTSILGLSEQEASNFPYIASMGVYVFKTDVLLNLLKSAYPSCNDFGSEIIPSAVKDHNVQAYLFNDYWEDIGTVKSFFDANLALTKQPPKFDFNDPKTPFYTSARFLPPTKVDKSRIVDAIISHGCFLRECNIQHSIVGVRSRLDYGVEFKDTMMMGADYYQTECEIASLLAEGKVPIGVGPNTKIQNCIIDKNAKIGKDVVILNKEGVEEADRSAEGFYIRSGITVIMKNATIKDGTVI